MSVKVRERPKGSGCYWVFIDHRGKRKSKKVGDKKTAQALAQKLQQKLTAGDLGLLEDKKQIPLFKEYAEKWLDQYIKTACKERTYELYKMLLNRHIYPDFKDKRIDQITLTDVKELFLKKFAEKLSVSSVLNIKACLSGVLSNAVEDELIIVNFASRTGKLFKRFKKQEPKHEVNPLTKDEVRLLLTTIADHYPRYYPLFLCCFRTGMRIGEVLALQWGDIDFHSRFIQVQRCFSMGKITTPKSGKSRRVDMSLQLEATLKGQKLDTKKEALLKGWLTFPECVFVSEAGTPYDPNNLRKIFNKCLDKAGLRRIRIHDMRHTFASMLLALGEPLLYVKDQLGHQSIQITVDTYGHLIPGANKSAVDKLDDEPATIRNLSATSDHPDIKKAPSVALSA